MSETTKRKIVEIIENNTTVRNLDAKNSFLLSPSMRFCFRVLLLYSLDIMDTITIAKKSFNQAATQELKCQMYGKLNIP